MRQEDIYHKTATPVMPPPTIYWCDACRHCDRLTSGAFVFCNLHQKTIFDPIGCNGFIHN